MPNEGRVHPQTVTTGVPTAAARCIIPVSPARTARAPRSRAAERRDREECMLNKQLLGMMLVSTADSHPRIQLN